jgi:hypothetical protein
MHVLCTDCGKTWNLSCPECAHDKASWHTRDTGHEKVLVTGTDKTKGVPFEDGHRPRWFIRQMWLDIDDAEKKRIRHDNTQAPDTDTGRDVQLH